MTKTPPTKCNNCGIIMTTIKGIKNHKCRQSIKLPQQILQERIIRNIMKEEKKQTQSEFIESYCKNSGITERELNKLGLFAIPCDCKQTEDCKGWAMISRENVKTHIELYLSPTSKNSKK